MTRRSTRGRKGAHIGTFRGHQVAMAAGLAAIEFMQEVDLAGHAAALGELTLELLREAQDTLPSVGDVRGRGLMIGIEMVKDRDTKEPWPEMAAQIRTECFRKGVIIEVGGHFGNVARFLPPLVITRELLLTGVEIFVDAVRASEEALARPAAAARRLTASGAAVGHDEVCGNTEQEARRRSSTCRACGGRSGASRSRSPRSRTAPRRRRARRRGAPVGPS